MTEKVEDASFIEQLLAATFDLEAPLFEELVNFQTILIDQKGYSYRFIKIRAGCVTACRIGLDNLPLPDHEEIKWFDLDDIRTEAQLNYAYAVSSGKLPPEIEIDMEGAWSSAFAMQADEGPIKVNDNIVLMDDNYSYTVKEIDAELGIATCYRSVIEKGKSFPDIRIEVSLKDIVLLRIATNAMMLHCSRDVFMSNDTDEAKEMFSKHSGLSDSH